MRKNPISETAPGLPERVQKIVDAFMSLTPENKLALADQLELTGEHDLVQFAAAIRRGVAAGEGEA